MITRGKTEKAIQTDSILFIALVLLPGIILASTVFFLSSVFALAPANNDAREEEIQLLFDQGWQLLSRMHEDLSGLDKALALYDKVLALDPENKDVYWKIAEITFKKADEEADEIKRKALYNKVLEVSKKAAKIDSNSVGAHYWMGVSSVRLAQMSGIVQSLSLVTQAKRELVKAIDLDPDHRFSVLAGAVLAAIYTESPWPLRNLDQALEYAQEAIAKDPKLTIASEKLAQVYFKKKQYDKAKKEIHRCLAIEEPTYIWDSILYDWPAVKRLLKELED